MKWIDRLRFICPIRSTHILARCDIKTYNVATRVWNLLSFGQLVPTNHLQCHTDTLTPGNQSAWEFHDIVNRWQLDFLCFNCQQTWQLVKRMGILFDFLWHIVKIWQTSCTLRGLVSFTLSSLLIFIPFFLIYSVSVDRAQLTKC